MTAFDLIDSIFARVQPDRPGNERGITGKQLTYLKDLIGADPEGGAIRQRGRNVWQWMPAGRVKYEITEDFATGRHKIARLSSGIPTGTGHLFT